MFLFLLGQNRVHCRWWGQVFLPSICSSLSTPTTSLSSAMQYSSPYSILQKVRRFALTAFFRLFVGSTIWSDDTRDRYEAILLTDSSVQQKERMLISSARTVFELVFLWLYLRYPFPERRLGYHIDVCKFITMRLHSVTGLVDHFFETDIDDHIASIYGPLRHQIAHKAIKEEDDSEACKTIAIFRFATHYVAIKSLTDSIFKGVTRPVNVSSERDMTMLYYDVLQGAPWSVVGEKDKRKILNGHISIIALSYRHAKDHRSKLGITKREFLSAIRALHAEAQPANPPNEYCFWWDSCLRCSPKENKTTLNWAAIGLAPYAFCHVLSIRRASEIKEERLWIEMERALARLSRGFTTVDVTDVEQRGPSSEQVQVYSGIRSDPQWALSEGLVYTVTGDLHNSEVTFPEDKTYLHRAGMLTLCKPGGISVYRALFDRSRTEVQWVSSWSALEEKAFLNVMLIRLGHDQVENGYGEAHLDICVQIYGETFVFNDRRSWFPNSSIYQLETGDDELPYFVRDQVALVIKTSEAEYEDNQFGLLLYYQEETPYYAEAVHGCVVNLVAPNKSLVADSISRLHVPRSCNLFEGFRQLYSITMTAPTLTVLPAHSEMLFSAVGWLWEENEMQGDKNHVYFEAPHL